MNDFRFICSRLILDERVFEDFARNGTPYQKVFLPQLFDYIYVKANKRSN